MTGRLFTAFLVVLTGLPVGMLGAYAFHPDDGWILRSQALWTVFGTYAYVGLLLTAPLALALLARSAIKRVLSGRA